MIKSFINQCIAFYWSSFPPYLIRDDGPDGWSDTLHATKLDRQVGGKNGKEEEKREREREREWGKRSKREEKGKETERTEKRERKRNREKEGRERRARKKGGNEEGKKWGRKKTRIGKRESKNENRDVNIPATSEDSVCQLAWIGEKQKAGLNERVFNHVHRKRQLGCQCHTSSSFLQTCRNDYRFLSRKEQKKKEQKKKDQQCLSTPKCRFENGSLEDLGQVKPPKRGKKNRLYRPNEGTQRKMPFTTKWNWIIKNQWIGFRKVWQLGCQKKEKKRISTEIREV